MNIKINMTEDGTLRYPPHSHREYEVMQYVRGSGVMWTEKGELPFSPGDAVIIPPGVMHGSVSEDGFVNISVEYDFEGLLITDSPLLIFDTPSGDGANLVQMIWNNRYGNEAYLNSLLVAYARYLSSRLEIHSAMSICLGEVKMKISDAAFDPEINVSEILRSSGYAEDYIRAAFKREVGKTPIEFLTELRIKRACYLIDIYGDKLPLSEIAERCGYLDYVYFSKKFKEYTGIAPRGYKYK